jgi:hypothetical protein
MATRDLYHYQVRRALEKDGWTITHDPFYLYMGQKRLSADMGAERLLSAEKGVRKIVVEVKSFVGKSDVNDLEQALGQFILYRQIMDENEIERELFLAVPNRTFKGIFQIPLGMMVLKNRTLNLIVFDEKREVIMQWIPK